jgi:hypothetical protein
MAKLVAHAYNPAIFERKKSGHGSRASTGDEALRLGSGRKTHRSWAQGSFLKIRRLMGEIRPKWRSTPLISKHQPPSSLTEVMEVPSGLWCGLALPFPGIQTPLVLGS